MRNAHLYLEVKTALRAMVQSGQGWSVGLLDFCCRSRGAEGHRSQGVTRENGERKS